MCQLHVYWWDGPCVRSHPWYKTAVTCFSHMVEITDKLIWRWHDPFGDLRQFHLFSTVNIILTGPVVHLLSLFELVDKVACLIFQFFGWDCDVIESQLSWCLFQLERNEKWVCWHLLIRRWWLSRNHQITLSSCKKFFSILKMWWGEVELSI
jgi:hypothetical protein